jgi:molecular chaperone GrpE (heat shock protein)
MPAGEVPPGSVAAVIRAGYALDGRLLRPAQVVVARAEGP